jgi:transposase-like protein
MKICRHCKSENTVRAGFRRTNKGLIQQHKCKSCGTHFVVRDGFERMRFDPKIIVCALDLRANGMSYGKIAKHLKAVHSVTVTRAAILGWVEKFGSTIQSFIQQHQLECSLNLHADEMFLKRKGGQPTEFSYYWAAIDYGTKFVIADHISTIREDLEAVHFLKKVRKKLKLPPEYLHTDNSYDYPPAIRKVFTKSTQHIHFPAWKKKFKNNPIERYFNTCREITKNLRRFKNAKHMEENFAFFTMYYNYLRPHMSLGNRTPAQVAGLGVWNWWSLIKDRTFYVLKVSFT